MTKRMGKVSLAVMTLVAAMFVCSSASAWWGGCCGFAPRPLWGGCCYSPCVSVCDPCCSPCFSSCSPCDSYVLGYRPGPVRRLLFGPYRWYNVGYNYGWGNSSCCWTDSCNSCCDGGGDVIYDSVPASVTPAAPLKKSTIEPNPVAIRGQNPAPQNTSHVYQTSYQKFQNSQNKDNSGMLTIFVPLDAKVYVNDKLTSTEGSKRAFVSFGLEEGYEYEFHVRAEVVRNGKLHPETQTILLHAGENLSVSFPFKSLNKLPSEADYGL